MPYQVKDDVLIIVVIGIGKRQNVYDTMANRLPINLEDIQNNENS